MSCQCLYMFVLLCPRMSLCAFMCLCVHLFTTLEPFDFSFSLIIYLSCKWNYHLIDIFVNYNGLSTMNNM